MGQAKNQLHKSSTLTKYFCKGLNKPTTFNNRKTDKIPARNLPEQIYWTAWTKPIVAQGGKTVTNRFYLNNISPTEAIKVSNQSLPQPLKHPPTQFDTHFANKDLIRFNYIVQHWPHLPPPPLTHKHKTHILIPPVHSLLTTERVLNCSILFIKHISMNARPAWLSSLTPDMTHFISVRSSVPCVLHGWEAGFLVSIDR